MKARDGERRKAGKIVWLKKKRACLFGTHVMNACWDNRCVVMSFSVCECTGRSNSKVHSILWSVVKFSVVPVEKSKLDINFHAGPSWFMLIWNWWT